jgi:hypothetical protein
MPTQLMRGSSATKAPSPALSPHRAAAGREHGAFRGLTTAVRLAAARVLPELTESRTVHAKDGGQYTTVLASRSRS